MTTVLTSECNSYIQSNTKSGSDSSQRFYEKWFTFEYPDLMDEEIYEKMRK